MDCCRKTSASTFFERRVDASPPVGARDPHRVPDHRAARGDRGRFAVDTRHLSEAELPAGATMSMEIDILPIAENNDEMARFADLIEGVAGEFSPFEDRQGTPRWLVEQLR